MSQDLEPAIADPPTRVFAQIKLSQLRHLGQVLEAFVAEPLRTAKV